MIFIKTHFGGIIIYEMLNNHTNVGLFTTYGAIFCTER